ncbi:MAG: type II secretion system F family protein [Acidimicrobiales bacterium]
MTARTTAGTTAMLLGGIAALVVADLAWPATTRADLPRPRRTISPLARHATAATAVLAVGAIAPPMVLLGALGWFGTREVRRRRARHAQRRAIRHGLPDLVDLLRLATTAGLTLAIAHPLVAPHVSPPVGPALLQADASASRGRPRADALLDALTPFGDRAHALGHVLSDHLRYGVPLLPALERTGLELRLDRRRAAELDARRVPVRLLAPLVSCVLPAFALLTVVPLLAASLEALPV